MPGYYFLRQDLFDAEDIIEVVGHTEETGKFMWVEGTRFDEDLPVQTLELDPAYGTTMPDFFDTTIPLMSDRLVEAVRKAGVDNFDAYPMILRRRDTGEEWRNYNAMNFIGSIDAIDREKSDCQRSASGRLLCESITIDPKAAGDAICFRLTEGPHLLVVHERVATALKKQNFVAVLIQKTEDYDGD